jgi:nicotinic acid mononucleotide adenylyltransferase
VFVPSAQNPIKAHRPEANAETRPGMLIVVAACETNMKVCLPQISGLVPNYTAGFLSALKDPSPRSSPFLVRGSDCIKDLAMWREVEELPNWATPLIVVREGQPDIGDLISQSALSRTLRYWLERALFVGPVGDITSSRVRRSLRESELRSRGDSPKALPRAVQEIIEQKGLYFGRSGEVRLP